MKKFLVTLLCAAITACGGSAADDSAASRSSSDAQLRDRDVRESARDELFAVDAEHTSAIERLGPVLGLLRPMRGDALYLTAGIDIVRGKRRIAETLEAATPDAAHTSLTRTLAGGDASADGRFGFTFGWLTRTERAADGSTLTSYGTYVSTWAREDKHDAFRVAAYYTRTKATPHEPTRDDFPYLLLGRGGAGGFPHRGDLEKQKRSLLQTDADFAALSVAEGYSLAFPAYAGAFVMPSGRDFFFLKRSVDHDEVADFYAGWTPAEVLNWTPLFAGCSESGDLGYTVGTSVDTVTNDNGTVDRFYSKYLTLWARQSDGAWRFIADGGASSPPPSP